MIMSMKNVFPDATASCGPYSPLSDSSKSSSETKEAAGGVNDHDTIGILVIDKVGDIAAGTSTNGLSFKIPG